MAQINIYFVLELSTQHKRYLVGKIQRYEPFSGGTRRNSAASGKGEVEEQPIVLVLVLFCLKFRVRILAGGRQTRDRNGNSDYIRLRMLKGGAARFHFHFRNLSLSRHHARRIADSSNCAVAVATNTVVGFQYV